MLVCQIGNCPPTAVNELNDASERGLAGGKELGGRTKWREYESMAHFGIVQDYRQAGRKQKGSQGESLYRATANDVKLIVCRLRLMFRRFLYLHDYLNLFVCLTGLFDNKFKTLSCRL